MPGDIHSVPTALGSAPDARMDSIPDLAKITVNAVGLVDTDDPVGYHQH